MRRTVPVDQWPDGRTVLEFRFADQPAATARWWLCVAGRQADVCDYDPGFDVTATVQTTLRTMVAIWRADRSWPEAIRSGQVVVEGPSAVRRAVPEWLGQMVFAAVPRPA